MYKAYPNLVDDYLKGNILTGKLLDSIIVEGIAKTSGSHLLEQHLDPMIDAIYSQLRSLIKPEKLTENQAKLFIGELSVFARYNSTMLLRSADNIRGFCPELAQELTRNFLEEGGERGKLPAHYVVFSGALLADLDFRVNGWMPRINTTRSLLTLIDILTWSHCPSTVLGMYYATEAVAIAETMLLRDIIDRLGVVTGRGSRDALPRLDFYFRMHLDENHDAATNSIAVEQGHQDGIARFIRDADLFSFLQPQIVDGFLQMLNAFVDQWVELHHISASSN